MAGAKVFDETYPCTADASNADYGKCPKPVGTIGEMWNGEFGFDVPAIAPPFQYDVHVLAKTADGTTLWELESKFTI